MFGVDTHDSQRFWNSKYDDYNDQNILCGRYKENCKRIWFVKTIDVIMDVLDINVGIVKSVKVVVGGFCKVEKVNETVEIFSIRETLDVNIC